MEHRLSSVLKLCLINFCVSTGNFGMCASPYCEFFRLWKKEAFERVLIIATKTPCWWHVWCTETCSRIIDVCRIFL